MEEETAVPAAGWIPADGPDLWGPLGGPGAHRPKAHADVRISNMSLILRHLQTSPALSRTRLARETGLSKATVSTLVAELCSRGLLIEEEPDLSGNVGRPSTGLRTAPRTAAGIGLEISGASLLLSITDLTGEVIARRCELVADTGHNPDTMIEHMAAMLSQALEQLTQQGTTVPGIVLAQPGIIDYTDNTVRYSSTLEWHDVAVADRVRNAVARRLGPGRSVPTITLENDAKLAALATYERYAQDGVRNLLYLSGSEGIGAGIISDGHLLRGWLGLTGEVGHMPVEPEGPECRCGRRGCWETRSGLQALISAYPPSDAVRDETTSLDERIELLRRRFDAGDAELTRRLELSQRALARALAILTDVLNPEVIVLSGYLAAFADVFVSPTASALRDRLLNQRAAVRLETSHLGQWASSYGAALVALESVLDNPTLVDLRPTS